MFIIDCFLFIERLIIKMSNTTKIKFEKIEIIIWNWIKIIHQNDYHVAHKVINSDEITEIVCFILSDQH